MHAANLETSERLQRVATLLDDGRPHSTMEIIAEARVCAVNSIISELRRNGVQIKSRCEGRGKWTYQKEA